MEGQVVLQWFHDTWNDWMTYYWIDKDHPFARLEDSKRHKKVGVCSLCGLKGKTYNHHIIHVADGGANTPDNVCEVCIWCHANYHKFKNGFLNVLIKKDLEILCQR